MRECSTCSHATILEPLCDNIFLWYTFAIAWSCKLCLKCRGLQQLWIDPKSSLSHVVQSCQDGLKPYTLVDNIKFDCFSTGSEELNVRYLKQCKKSRQYSHKERASIQSGSTLYGVPFILVTDDYWVLL